MNLITGYFRNSVAAPLPAGTVFGLRRPIRQRWELLHSGRRNAALHAPGVGRSIWRAFSAAGLRRRSTEVIAALPDHSAFKWSWFYWIHSPMLLWTFHIAALVVFALLTIGLWSRTMSVLAFLATVSYINRASLAQFGLDDTNAMLAMYLMIGPCGAAYSVDRWLKRRRGTAARRSNPALCQLWIRLIQVHLCVLYLFSGIGKLQGPWWWNGNSLLMAMANREYQSLDGTLSISLGWFTD